MSLEHVDFTGPHYLTQKREAVDGRPKPAFYVAFEGGKYHPWGDWHEQVRDTHGLIHAIIFDDGSVFDAINGWRTYDGGETLARARGHDNHD
jgi:hypothetical protein